MIKIRIPVTIPTANITEVSPGQYRFVVLAQTTSGNPLNHPNIPNSTTFVGPVYSTSGANSIFRIDVNTTLTPTQSVPLFRLVVYRSNTSDTCFQTDTHSIAGSVNCDLSQTTAPSFRILSGQKQVRVYLYSGRPNLHPFIYRIYNSSNVLSQTISGVLDSTQYVNLNNSLPDGNYTVTVEDKDGCVTESQAFTIATPTTCTKENLVELWWRASSAGPPRIPFTSHGDAGFGLCTGSGSGSSAQFENGLGVGNEVWMDASPSNCNTLPDGYYYFRDPSLLPGDTRIYKTGRIQNGVVTELEDFGCSPASISPNSDMTLLTES